MDHSKNIPGRALSMRESGIFES